MTPEQIAEVCHEANRCLQRFIGEAVSPPWPFAPAWQRESALAGVTATLEGRIQSPEESHASWLAQKEADGWVWGPVKDPEAKTHPCMVPYDQLPEAQRVKDALFQAIVGALGPCASSASS